MWINRFLEKVGLPKWSLVITGYVVISLLLSFISYVILEESLYSLTSKVVNQSPSYADEMDRINRDIQAYITNHQLSLENAKQLEEWHRAHDDLLILIYQGDELYYDSSLISYGYQESDVMYIPKTYALQFSDGTAWIDIYPFFNLNFYLWGRVLCVIASMVIFMITFMTLLHRQITYILEISHAVERMKNGQLSTQIEVRGQHEISQLAADINDMAKTLEQQIELEKELKQQNIQIIRSLSHDLRTPLTAVISYLDIIKQEKDKGEQTKYLEIVSSKAFQIKYLIDQLFRQCVVEEKKAPVMTLNADEMIEQCLHEVVSSLESDGFEALVEVEIENSFSLQMERHDFYRLIDNICSNLLKYADASHPIKFRICELEDVLVIKVCNKVLLQISDEIESHGVGLQSCRMLIESVGGKLEVYQEADQFIFECELPILQNC